MKNLSDPYIKLIEFRKAWHMLSNYAELTKIKIPILFFIVLMGLLFSSQCSARQTKTLFEDSNRRVIEVIDGDTFKINGEKIRLWGIDAPELHQTCFKQSKAVNCGEGAKIVLMALLKMDDLTCVVINTDRYRRSVSRCSAGVTDIGGYLVRAGWAIDYFRYSKGYYKNFENEAKTERFGLWNMTFEVPETWRRGHR